MNLDFQKELLQFLAQTPNSRKHIEILDTDVFDLATHINVYGLIKGFTAKYGSQPSLPNLLEYFDRQLKNTKADVGKEVKDAVVEAIREAYEPFRGNADFIREVLIEQYQIKLMKKVFTENVMDLKKAEPDIIKKVFTEVSRIKKLSDQDADEERNTGRFALEEFKKGQRSIIEATATYLKALNRMTSTKGFYSPQLIILMGAPKSFKTGTTLNLAMNLVRDGERVYYVDCENGEDRILDRFYQCMLEATWAEYDSGDLDEILEEQVGRFKTMGGDFRSDFYPAHQKSTQDVEERLEVLKREHNWIPTVIIWDYLDLMKPEDFTIKEKRLKIQAVYHDAIRLHKRWGIWGLGPSQVNKEAVNKTVIDMTNFSEDFGKAANCHAAFALCRTPYEKEAGVMRIVPVLQRDGVAQHSNYSCFVDVDEARMTVKEIKYDEWEKRTAVFKVSNVKKKPTTTDRTSTHTRPKKNLKDE